ncbi:Rap1a/Tai family immunity protein [Erythrobacter oryzae]|uniref:Rap1a/Tai family immunity protein n=1 Tax=Erythrobacter oryzae TaxID=3019556 RepID=UPI00255474C3|nr:Rap1a/Tai family immunity protein [Erythrobacter sp. COR-2]
MKRDFPKALILLGATLSASAAIAQADMPAQTMQFGNHALAMCGSPETEQDGWICMSWINGAMNAARIGRSVTPEAPDYCTPPHGGTIAQYRDLFVAFLKEHPDKQHLPAIFLFHQAMAAAFPCGKTSK